MSTQYKNKYPKNQAENLSTFVFGKVQPQATDLEEAVLGALMLDSEALDLVSDVLLPGSFYLESHQNIYAAIISLSAKSQPVDMMTVTEELKRLGTLDAIGGGYYIVELSSRVASAANIEHHARIIAQKHIQRELIRVSTQTIRDAYEDTTDVFNLQDEAETALFEISNGLARNTSRSTTTLVTSVLKNLEVATQAKGLTGVPTGLRRLDILTGGWQSPDLIILAARPGMGKTSLMLLCALEAAKSGVPVQIFSLEMSDTQLMARLVSIVSGVPLEGVLKGRVLVRSETPYLRELTADEWQRIKEAAEFLTTVPIHIDDTAAITLAELKKTSRRAKQKNKVGLVLVDYLQLMRASNDRKGGDLTEETTLISQGLKAIAKTLKIPVIALSQLSRAVETRGGSKRPQLSDLRQSGAIEQDADLVCFLYRPEYYQIMEDETGRSLKGVAEIIIAKHRNGALDDIEVGFESTLARFGDLKTFDAPSAPSTQFPTTTIPRNTAALSGEDVPF